MSYLAQALLEGRITQPAYLFLSHEEFENLTQAGLSKEMHLEAQKRCCETLVRKTVGAIMQGSTYTFDWRPSVRQALELLGKNLSDFADIDALNRRTFEYKW